MINEVILSGRLGKDPFMGTTQKGTKVANFTLANHRTRKEGAQPVWTKVAIFGPYAEKLAEYLEKGRKVFIIANLVGSDHYLTQRGKASLQEVLQKANTYPSMDALNAAISECFTSVPVLWVKQLEFGDSRRPSVDVEAGEETPADIKQDIVLPDADPIADEKAKLEARLAELEKGTATTEGGDAF